MLEARNTDAGDVPADGKMPVTADTVKVGEDGAAVAEKLSSREALEVALEATKAPGKDAVGRPIEEANPKHEAKSAIADSPKNPDDNAETATVEHKEEAEKSKLQPPAEYTAEEKADFLALSPKGQAAQLRLDKSRKAKLEEIKAATKEHEYVKKLADAITPYLKTRGIDEAPEVALQKAIAMWREFEDNPPEKGAAAFLKAKGRPIPKELLEESEVNPLAPEIASLQEDLKSVKNELNQRKVQETAAVLQETWTAFEGTKNASGSPKYPDLGNTESGFKLASKIGSLVSGNTELSKQFIADAKERIPDLTYERLLEEAYRLRGGRVDDSPAAKTQDTQKHIIQSRRASASRPGSGANSASNGLIKKYKTNREALAAAIAQLNSED